MLTVDSVSGRWEKCNGLFRDLDRYAGYIPGVSTVVAIVNIFMKIVVIPNLSTDIKSTNSYFRQINGKSSLECMLLFIPFLNLSTIYIHRHSKNSHCSNKKETKPTNDPGKVITSVNQLENGTSPSEVQGLDPIGASSTFPSTQIRENPDFSDLHGPPSMNEVVSVEVNKVEKTSPTEGLDQVGTFPLAEVNKEVNQAPICTQTTLLLNTDLISSLHSSEEEIKLIQSDYILPSKEKEVDCIDVRTVFSSTTDSTPSRKRQVQLAAQNNLQIPVSDAQGLFLKIEGIQKQLQAKSLPELESIYKPHIDTIIELRNKIRTTHFEGEKGIEIYGIAACSRLAWLDPDVHLLLTPPVLVAIAAYAIAYPTISNSLVDVCKYRGGKITLFSSLYFCLKDNSQLVLESMPPNKSTNENEGKEWEESLYNRYLKQKEGARGLSEIIDHAWSGLCSHNLSSQNKVPKEGTALVKMLTDSSTLLARIALLKDIQVMKCAKVASMFGDPWSLAQQVMNGLISSVKKLGISHSVINEEFVFEFNIEISFTDFITQFAKSPVLLIPDISHNIDRVHLFVALSCIGENRKVKFSKDDSKSIKEIYTALILFITKNINDPETFITSEQLAIRLFLIQETLNKFEQMSSAIQEDS